MPSKYPAQAPGPPRRALSPRRRAFVGFGFGAGQHGLGCRLDYLGRLGVSDSVSSTPEVVLLFCTDRSRAHALAALLSELRSLNAMTRDDGAALLVLGASRGKEFPTGCWSGRKFSLPATASCDDDESMQYAGIIPQWRLFVCTSNTRCAQSKCLKSLNRARAYLRCITSTRLGERFGEHKKHGIN